MTDVVDAGLVLPGVVLCAHTPKHAAQAAGQNENECSGDDINNTEGFDDGSISMRDSKEGGKENEVETDPSNPSGVVWQLALLLCYEFKTNARTCPCIYDVCYITKGLLSIRDSQTSEENPTVFFLSSNS